MSSTAVFFPPTPICQTSLDKILLSIESCHPCADCNTTSVSLEGGNNALFAWRNQQQQHAKEKFVENQSTDKSILVPLCSILLRSTNVEMKASEMWCLESEWSNRESFLFAKLFMLVPFTFTQLGLYQTLWSWLAQIQNLYFSFLTTAYGGNFYDWNRCKTKSYKI